MPLIDKKDPYNWYNNIPRVDAAARYWENFSSKQLQGNEIQCGSETLAKIPQMPGRIARRNKKNGNGITHYVELILERTYDKEKHQTRNKRVIIGVDVSHVYPGMMIINKKYHDYFDIQGNLIYRFPEEPVAEEPEEAEATLPGPETDPMPEEQPEAEPEQSELYEEQYTEYEEDTFPIAETDSTEPDNPLAGDIPMTADEQDLEDEELKRTMQEREHRKDRINYLRDVLYNHKGMIDEQAKRRPDKPMTLYQIRRINELLNEIRNILTGYEGTEYLLLAEEPDPNNPDTQPMTYADMAILLNNYYCTLMCYSLGRLWRI